MRIATLCFSRTLGGLELATLRRGAELRAHGHHVVAILPEAPELIGRAEEFGIGVDRITPNLPYLDLPAARKLSMVLQREEIELILVARTRDLSTAMMAAGRDIAVVLYQQMQSGLDKHDWFHNKVFKRLDGCITITERGREELTTTTVLAPEKITVIHYGIDTASFSPECIAREEARREFSIPEDAFTVGIVGGFNPGKGQKEFIEGMRIAAEMEPTLGARLHLLIVGERPSDPADYVAELRRLRQDLPFAERAQLLPFASDPRMVYRALDLFVLASHSETFGMVLQEALAMGLPAVGTNSGGVPEIITDGHTGLLIEPKSPQAIADAVVRLYRDEQLRARLAHAGRDFAVQAYDAGRQYMLFEETLGKAVERRKRRG